MKRREFLQNFTAFGTTAAVASPSVALAQANDFNLFMPDLVFKEIEKYGIDPNGLSYQRINRAFCNHDIQKYGLVTLTDSNARIGRHTNVTRQEAHDIMSSLPQGAAVLYNNRRSYGIQSYDIEAVYSFRSGKGVWMAQSITDSNGKPRLQNPACTL